MILTRSNQIIPLVTLARGVALKLLPDFFVSPIPNHFTFPHKFGVCNVIFVSFERMTTRFWRVFFVQSDQFPSHVMKNCLKNKRVKVITLFLRMCTISVTSKRPTKPHILMVDRVAIHVSMCCWNRNTALLSCRTPVWINYSWPRRDLIANFFKKCVEHVRNYTRRERYFLMPPNPGHLCFGSLTLFGQRIFSVILPSLVISFCTHEFEEKCHSLNPQLITKPWSWAKTHVIKTSMPWHPDHSF